MMIDYKEVIAFWFQEIDASYWFKVDPEFDKQLTERFYDTYQQAVKGELAHWRETIEGRLAEIIVLDQFARNMFRNDAQAFAFDSLALVLAQEAIKDGHFKQLEAQKQRFMLMPFMHAESPNIQAQSVALFSELGLEKPLKYAIEHKTIIDKFGRFPHRNAVLNRQSTQEERECLKDFNSF
ncbi:DUF924 family protein [Aerococcaceae bacterium zg-1292]|uniref:DUF924 family protein n=1 Tax=Aerococcaceae bacterium zg-1292 TaxID=2774330 RepID=UPI0019AE7D98|nr:DUF924 domain-containing protein [Aerococcaceae bacterium zg-1292]